MHWGNSALIESSFATGTVTGSDSVGGLVGYLVDSDINNSYATGNVSGSDYLGGLVGWANPAGGTIIVNNSYSTGYIVDVATSAKPLVVVVATPPDSPPAVIVIFLQ